jgi:hypothetical protein
LDKEVRLGSLLTWIVGARWRRSLSHCIEGLLIQLPISLVVGNWWIGALCVVVWYWSRKKLEVEISAAHGRSHVFVWRAGWFPWHWTWYQLFDVVLPAISSMVIAWALHGVHLHFV